MTDKPLSIPLPLEPLFLARSLAMATTLQRGVVWYFIGKWWQAGCPELPQAEVNLSELAGCDQARWNRVRSTVFAAIDELVPQYRKRYARAAQSALRRRKFAMSGGLATKAKHAARKLANAPDVVAPARVRQYQEPQIAPAPVDQGKKEPRANFVG